MIQAPQSTIRSLNNNVVLPLLHSLWSRQITKTMLDYAITLPALLMLAPLMLIIAIAIKLESPGPVFYRRRKLGLHGREFTALTFRTAFVDGEDRLIRNREQWVAFLRNGRAMDDPRITRVGRFLRQSGLYQLPYLFNILSRDMALIGPQALTRKDMMRYGRRRVEMLTSVLPGLTGPWQLQSQKGSTADPLESELFYVQNWSVRLDLSILFNSLAVAFKGQAA